MPELTKRQYIYFAKPPDHMSQQDPSHERCWLLDGPCWEDGSSLHAGEVWIPRWLRNKGDHDAMLSMLQQEFMERIACLS